MNTKVSFGMIPQAKLHRTDHKRTASVMEEPKTEEPKREEPKKKETKLEPQLLASYFIATPGMADKKLNLSASMQDLTEHEPIQHLRSGQDYLNASRAALTDLAEAKEAKRDPVSYNFNQQQIAKMQFADKVSSLLCRISERHIKDDEFSAKRNQFMDNFHLLLNFDVKPQPTGMGFTKDMTMDSVKQNFIQSANDMYQSFKQVVKEDSFAQYDTYMLFKDVKDCALKLKD